MLLKIYAGLSILFCFIFISAFNRHNIKKVGIRNFMSDMTVSDIIIGLLSGAVFPVILLLLFIAEKENSRFLRACPFKFLKKKQQNEKDT